MSKKKLLFIFGTRPEAIKMAPLIKLCQSNNAFFDIKICTTGQHKEMLEQVMLFFDIKADYELSVMRHNQTLNDLTTNILNLLNTIITDNNFDLLLVQGDTTTAMTGALAAYYKKIKIGHIEAGLRSSNLYSPFPEEGNRKIISALAHYHFTPTIKATENLHKEAIFKNVFVTGNTVIDALLWGIEKVRNEPWIQKRFYFLNNDKRLILVTAHRRESFGEPFAAICHALLQIAMMNEDVTILYPVHLNPNIQEVVSRILSGHQNIHLIAPVSYPELLWLIDKSYFVITDSGGIQEEAPALGKPVLVIRDVTERQEGIDAGTALLVGTDTKKIVAAAQELLHNKQKYEQMARAINPYGDGTAAQKIMSILQTES